MKGKQKKRTEEISENKYLIWGMFFSFLVCLILFSIHKVEEDDVFWHLSTGRFIVENKYVPDKDVFGFTTRNTEWIPFEWGWDVISYGINNAAGYNGLTVFCSIIYSIIFLMYFLLLKKFKVNSLLSIILFFVLLMALFDRLSPRPHIFTYLFLVIILYLFLSFKYIDREKYFKRLYFLPVIFLIWGNLHLGVIGGIFLLFILILSEAVIYFYPKKFSSNEIKSVTKDNLIKLVIILAVSILVLLINPHGIQTYIYAYGHTKMKMLEAIAEWQNPFTGKFESTFVVTLYKVFLFLGLITLIYAFKKRDLTFALVYISFFIYSIRAIRFTVDYEIVILFFIAVSLDYYIKTFAKSNSFAGKIFYGNPSKIIIIIFLLFVSYQTCADNIYNTLKYNREFGFGLSGRYMPLDLINFMKEKNVAGTTLNNFETGGYLMWNFPGQKVFIDSRNLNDEIFTEYISMLYMKFGFEKKLEQFGIDQIIFFDPKITKYPNVLKQTITDYLSKNKNWKLVYWDDVSMLFLKDVPKNYELISMYGYKVYIPYDALFNQKEFEANLKNSPEDAKNEMKRKSDTEPNGYLFQGMNSIASKSNKKK